jgi:hypothetical protein
VTPKIPKPLQKFRKIIIEHRNNGVCANNEVFGRAVPPKTFSFLPEVERHDRETDESGLEISKTGERYDQAQNPNAQHRERLIRK